MSLGWPDLGSRIGEARKAGQLSQAELASAVALDRTAVTKLESGERKVDALELSRIAQVSKRPLEWFLAPPLPSVVSRRRSRAGDESKADALLDTLARDVRLLVELGLLVPPPIPSTVTVDSVTSAEKAARELRAKLKLAAGAVRDLASVAERAGLYAFSLDLGDASLDGSFVRLDSGGVALVN